MRVIAFLILFFSNLLLFSQVTIVEYKGNLYFRETPLSDWKALDTMPFDLPQGGGVKLDENSIARILVNNKSEVILYPETALEIESVSKYYVTLGLVYGKGRFDISFPKNSTFVLKTLTASFTIRNIKALVESDLNGKVEISVGFGECRFRYMIPHMSGKREFVLNQGMFFKAESPEKPYVFGMIDHKKEREIFEVVRLTESKELSYQEKIRRLALFTSYAYSVTQRYTSDGYKERSADFDSGRTLRDIHGNLVRVEQRILRPSPDTIQFINITKRPYYKDYTNTPFTTSRVGFRYSGGASENRIDLFAVSFSFNKKLPQRIENLPSFFADPQVEPRWATFVGANITSNNSFFVAEAYKYNELRGELINNTEVVGVAQDTNEKDRDIILTGVIDKNLLQDIINYNFIEKTPSSPTGELVKKTNPNEEITGAFWGLKTSDEFSVDGDIYKLTGYRYQKGGVGDYFWITSENYLISPSGSLRKKREIERDFDSLSSLLNNNFLQSIIYIKEDNNNNPTDNSYNATDSNIDIVIGGGVIHSSLESIYEGIRRWRD